MYPKVSINIVTWNSMEYLPNLLASIYGQTFTDYSVLIIDNASDDGIEEWVRREYPQTVFLRNMRNRGFAYAHNQGIRYALDHWPAQDYSDRYVLVTNPDIIMDPQYLARLMDQTAHYPRAAAFGGKLLRAFGENLQDDALKHTVRSDHLDSTGLQADAARRFTDRGAGEMDTKQYDHERKIFGVSGALALYRASALHDAAADGEYFDNDFFAYKEDVDLAWRLQILGWEARYEPEARAYHYRGMYGAEKSGWRRKIANRRAKSALRNYYSTRNQLFVLIKNQDAGGWFWSGARIAASEAARFFYVLIFEPRSLKAYFEAVNKFPKLCAKRFATFRRAQRSGRELRRWFI